MKKLLLVSITLILSIQQAFAEQCKGCNFNTKDILLVLAGIAFGALAIVFVASVVVYKVLNHFVTPKRKNVWPTFVGAIFGSVIGVINIGGLRFSDRYFLQPVILWGFGGALFGYYFTQKVIVGKDEDGQ